MLSLALVPRRWHPGAAFPVQVQNWDSPRGRNESRRSLRASLCDAQSRCSSAGDAKPRSRLGSSSHDAPDSGRTLGASLVRAIPKLGVGQQVQIEPSRGLRFGDLHKAFLNQLDRSRHGVCVDLDVGE